MLKYELVPRDWIVSRTALRVYCVSSVISVGLFLGLCWVAINGVPAAVEPTLDLLLLLGKLGAAVTLVGMEFFLFRFDNSPAVAQLLWFFLLILPLLGAPLYCFLIYSRSDAVKAACADRAQGASAL